jgi:hypothetical protein
MAVELALALALVALAGEGIVQQPPGIVEQQGQRTQLLPPEHLFYHLYLPPYDRRRRHRHRYRCHSPSVPPIPPTSPCSQLNLPLLLAYYWRWWWYYCYSAPHHQ